MARNDTSSIDIFCKRKQPLSFDDLQIILPRRRIASHKATLYREIQFLKDRGIIEEINLQDGRGRYELKGRSHHHHIVCVKCHDVKDVPLEEKELKREKQAIEKATKFTILKHSLEFFGLCANCR